MPADTFTSPDTEGDNAYEIVVEVSDGLDDSGMTENPAVVDASLPVTVTVDNVDETPEVTTIETSHTAPSFDEIEYDFEGTPNLVVADYNGRDEEGQDITWSLDGTDVGDFMIDPTSGVLSFYSSPNHEGPTDNGADNVYNIIVTASDTASPVNTRELNVTVTVDDVNERPDIREDTVANYMEVEYDFTGTPLDVHTFAATDYDHLDTFTWSLDGVDKDLLEIDSMSGVLTFKQDSNLNVGPLPNFEQPQDDTGDGSSNTYNVTVRATDDDTIDPKYSDYAVTITVNDVNEQPEFTGTPLASDDWNENDDRMNTLLVHEYAARDEEGSVTWSLIGPDSG